jgi:diguanylate cyclase (GGDEF)-like protein
LLFLAPLLLYEGIRQFRGKPHHSVFHYALMAVLLGVFIYFTWLHPDVNARLLTLTICIALVIGRCAYSLFVEVPGGLRSSFWLTAAMFGLYDVVLILRLITAGSLPALHSPFSAVMWQTILFLATIVMPIGWTFGFFMMTNDRLTLELRKAEVGLREMAATDFLTGALNLRAFLETSAGELERARRNEQSILLLIFDIDHFKEYNDTNGHLAGDDMLCKIVAACRLALRAVDLLARWGGDEFVILLPDTDQAGGLVVAEKLRRAVAGLSVPLDTGQYPTTISLGGSPAKRRSCSLLGQRARRQLCRRLTIAFSLQTLRQILGLYTEISHPTDRFRSYQIIQEKFAFESTCTLKMRFFNIFGWILGEKKQIELRASEPLWYLQTVEPKFY